MKQITLLFICIFVLKTAFAQQSAYIENVFLSTDRSIYISGELIHFNAIVNSNKNLASKVLYVELIDPSGKQIVGMKCKIHNNVCKGILQIPEKLNTGYFYLRSYTKYMRNFSDHSFDYLQLRLINPYTSEVRKDQNDLEQAVSFDIDTLSNSEFFKIKIQETSFNQNEKIDVKVFNEISDSLTNVNVSIVPKHSINYNRLKLSEKYQKSNKYVSETRGVSLTGVLKDKEKNQLLNGKKVNLSILDQNKNIFYSVLTDSSGQFYFSLPDIYGRRDIYLSSEEIEGSTPEILVDIDFSNEKLNLPDPTFALNEQESIMAYKLAINKKVQDSFNQSMIEKVVVSSVEEDSVPFYGKPTNTLYLDDYILLPKFEDCFTELSFSVKIRKVNGKKRFKIFGYNSELSIYDPLVMVDLVAINDIDEILKASPKDILKIDVVAVPYVRGNIMYGGIINIVTRKNDLAGIKLSKSGIFINYLFLSENYIDKSNAIQSTDIPDARNTLYWNPDLNFNNKKAEFSFFTSNTPGDYTVYLTGVTSTGKVYNTWTDIVVK